MVWEADKQAMTKTQEDLKKIAVTKAHKNK